MQKARNGPGTGVKPRKDVLASLKMASMEEISRASLPAEIMSSILDYLSPVDLIRAARSSKLLREIAYDDTRWVQKLKRMGCWDEVEARKHTEEVFGTIADMPSVERQEAVDVQQTHGAPAGKGLQATESDLKSISDGFDQIRLSTATAVDISDGSDSDPVLGVLKRVKSIRGEARQEYGKIHAALAPYYEDISTSGASPDNLLFKQYTDPLHQAIILSQLQLFSKCDSTDDWRERVARLQTAVSMFETAALKEFRHGYETEDIDDRMRKYAHVLYTLNGGSAAAELFIHHNHLVTRRSDLGRVADCIDPLAQQVKLQHTQVFFTRLSVAYNEEVSIINRAFPPSLKVATPFIDKLGQDVLYPFLTAIFDELHRLDIEAYLTAISGTFAQCLNLLDTLLPIQSSDDSFDEFLERVIVKSYEPHLDLYLAEELDHFRAGSEAAVGEWDRQLLEQAASTESFLMSNINRQADKRDFLTSFKKVIMAPVAILPSFSGNKANESKRFSEPTPSDTSSLKSPNRFSTIASPTTPPILDAPPTTELAAKAAIMKSKMEGIRSLFSIELALSLVHAAKSSLERAAQFVKIKGEYGIAVKQQCEAIFVALVRILGHRHLIGGFNRAVDHLSNYRPREQGERDQSGVEPLVTFLELVNVGDLILQMIDVFYEQELIGTKLTDRNDFLDPAVKEKKKFEQNLDERVAAGLNKGIDVLMEEVDYILATRQLATDFNPSISTDPYRRTMDVSITEAAAAVVDVVSSHTQMLVGSTDKSMLDVFNQEVGLRLFSALCKHLKRQRISVEGSLKLISDMNHYFKFIQNFKNNDLLLYFKAFRELSQIYLIDPSDAKELATIIADADRFNGIWRVEEVYEFAERRADWYQVKRDVERAMYGIGCNVM
ncbi:secretion pathway protein Sls2/Rcy1 [Aspergillus heteromorphus CBS 117.55]|uniref:Secretion pathway protein Sls2/Rcy1 n=1 Tax=Aspergillus heteromorphus CBS 117.55 TaxID=1448321 RepID=A0A317WKC1_9EURO|nr:secretion pathway protein Sls2/Rcy1 [Aspergillus heteromorphus CBS 117.55]PWY86916.1 secretion pathway protein Sls2/Rcy1 [Aspergillus heteromorphus CBS 117.55]